ncbi:MAG: thioredoxin domain-containing protein [Nitrososphaerota archaeon]|nr:thioredoxin domain-containing protein [Nitrososphaerota archaeon]
MTSETGNRLVGEKSPYLLEHSRNPVDWWPWGKEAATKAKNDGKPIFLSIGYSTCHWCHVMRRESFEDPKTAAYINKRFIPVKVDREERPEVDAYYMGAVQAMTGGGGWPLSVFLTPDLKPFYGGTYFPPEPRFGMPSFMQVLEFVANLWKDKRDEVTANTEQVMKALSEQSGTIPGKPDRSALEDGFAELVSSVDQAHGGFGTAPKFPLPVSLGFLLRYHFRSRNELALRAVQKTLDEMMAGGIRDHVGGGFHRYSTDRTWLVPHFEKMLYDNALLARVYAEAYQVTGKAEYAEVVRDTLGWLAREMRSQDGGFYSAQDADTEQGEGQYYTWNPSEVADAAGEKDGRTFIRAYGVTSTGNFEGRSILHLQPGARSSDEEKRALDRAKRALYMARLERPRPATDSKVLTSWNGLAISAFAFAGGVLGDPGLTRLAGDAANFVLAKNSARGRLLRRYAAGSAGIPGTIEDYAFFVQGLIDLFESDPDPRWLEEATGLAEVMVREYEDPKDGGFFFSLEAEPARLKESYDGPTPSGNAVAAFDLLRLGELTGDVRFTKAGERTASAFAGDVSKRPSAHAQMLAAIDLLLNGRREVVITAPTLDGAAPMLRAAFKTYAPDRALLTATEETFQSLAKLSGLLEGREPGRTARGYVCRNSVCDVPAVTPDGLSEQLAR